MAILTEEMKVSDLLHQLRISQEEQQRLQNFNDSQTGLIHHLSRKNTGLRGKLGRLTALYNQSHRELIETSELHRRDKGELDNINVLLSGDLASIGNMLPSNDQPQSTPFGNSVLSDTQPELAQHPSTSPSENLSYWTQWTAETHTPGSVITTSSNTGTNQLTPEFDTEETAEDRPTGPTELGSNMPATEYPIPGAPTQNSAIPATDLFGAPPQDWTIPATKYPLFGAFTQDSAKPATDLFGALPQDWKTPATKYPLSGGFTHDSAKTSTTLPLPGVATQDLTTLEMEYPLPGTTCHEHPVDYSTSIKLPFPFRGSVASSLQQYPLNPRANWFIASKAEYKKKRGRPITDHSAKATANRAKAQRRKEIKSKLNLGESNNPRSIQTAKVVNQDRLEENVTRGYLIQEGPVYSGGK